MVVRVAVIGAGIAALVIVVALLVQSGATVVTPASTCGLRGKSVDGIAYCEQHGGQLPAWDGIRAHRPCGHGDPRPEC